MRIMKTIYRFQFNNDLIIAYEVWDVNTAVSTFVKNLHRSLRGKWNLANLQFFFQRMLIDFFKIAIAELFVNLIYGTTNGERLFSKNQIFCHLSVSLLYLTTEGTEAALRRTRKTIGKIRFAPSIGSQSAGSSVGGCLRQR